MGARVLDDPRIRQVRVDSSAAEAAQPAISTPAGAAPGLTDWEPESDLAAPEDVFARLYVPTSERVPPMPPVRASQPQAEAVQAKNLVTASGQELHSELGFPAHSVIVDNLTNQWVFFTSARRWVAPYCYGAIIAFVQGTQVAAYICSQPPGGFTQPVPIAGEIVQTSWLAAFQSPTTGTIVTKA